MLLHRQTVFRPRSAGCWDSWSSIPAALNTPRRPRLPHLRLRTRDGRGRGGRRQAELRKRPRERERTAGRPLFPDLRTPHCAIVTQCRRMRRRSTEFLRLRETLAPLLTWGCSSIGRALEWHSGGRRFDPDQLHQLPIQDHKTAAERPPFLFRCGVRRQRRLSQNIGPPPSRRLTCRRLAGTALAKNVPRERYARARRPHVSRRDAGGPIESGGVASALHVRIGTALPA